MRIPSRFAWSCFLFVATFARAESIFPLGRGAIPAASLPPPYGVGLGWYRQDQDYRLESLTFAVPGVPGGFPAASQLVAENTSRYTEVRPGLQLLPFLQVYGIFGRIESDTIVRNVPLIGQVTTSGDGSVYGGGATLAFGRGDWFGLLSLNYAAADLSQVDSRLRTFTLEPRVGRKFGRLAAWVGGMYQNAEEKASGTFTLTGLGPVPYAVTLQSESAWNYHVGAQWSFNRHVGVVADFGFGQRQSVYLSLELAW